MLKIAKFYIYSNPALKYVKTIKEKFDVNLFISEKGFSM